MAWVWTTLKVFSGFLSAKIRLDLETLAQLDQSYEEMETQENEMYWDCEPSFIQSGDPLYSDRSGLPGRWRKSMRMKWSLLQARTTRWGLERYEFCFCMSKDDSFHHPDLVRSNQSQCSIFILPHLLSLSITTIYNSRRENHEREFGQINYERN